MTLKLFAMFDLVLLMKKLGTEVKSRNQCTELIQSMLMFAFSNMSDPN